MTGKERMTRILKHQPVDHIGLYEHFWGDTHKEWCEKGWIKSGDNMADVFHYDMDELWAFKLVADLDFKAKVISEDAETVTILDGNGATLRRHKFHDTTPEHINFSVTSREVWEEKNAR